MFYIFLVSNGENSCLLGGSFFFIVTKKNPHHRRGFKILKINFLRKIRNQFYEQKLLISQL